MADLAEMIVAGAVIAFIKGVERLLAGANQAFRVAQTLLFLLQLFQFAVLQGQGVQLFQLETQQLFFFVLLAGLIQGVVVGAAGLLPVAPVFAHGVGQIAGVGKVVEQLPMGFFLHQSLVFVLAVDADQSLTQLSHFRQRGGGAVYIGPGATIGTHGAAQQALVIIIQLPIGQPLAGGRVVADIKGGEHFRPVVAVADNAGVGPVAQGQAQGIDDHGLARPGFPADRGEAVFRLQFQLVHGGKVTNAQMGQHGISPKRASQCDD